MDQARAQAFKPKYQELDREQAEMLLMCSIGEKESPKGIPESEWPFTMQIMQKRIDAYQLPIKFTPWAFAAAGLIFGTNPGRAISVLIDCLEKFEGQEINMDKLCQEIYPWGFYTEDSFGELVLMHKDRVYKWSRIY